jgi:hypothetical protein
LGLGDFDPLDLAALSFVWEEHFVVDFLTLLVEAKAASLYLLVCEQLLVLLLVADQIVLLKTTLVKITLCTPIKDTFKIRSSLSILMNL